MSSYASLVSLMTLIYQIQKHPCPPITLDKPQVESLTQKITLLQEFLQVRSHSAIKEAADGLESRMADAAYAAADMIESHIADQIHSGSTGQGVEIEHLYQDLHRAILAMDIVTKEAMETEDKIDHQLHGQLICHSSERPFVVQKNVMVGFNDVFDIVLDKLTADQSSRRIIPIVGMGGIGKTTLATNAYENQFIAQHFDFRSWVIVSQDYNVRDILLKVLLHQNKKGSSELLSQMSEGQLGDKLCQSLYGRRYLVVLDDMWSGEVWNEINRFFPENNNRSRIIITTRLSSVASELFKDKIEMDFLDNDESWNLLCNVVFGEDTNCPVELEESGRKIARNCRGLPLSITVMGGLLAKSKRTQNDWAFIAENLNSSIHLEHEKSCLQILHTSFDHLPVHLKACFLYIGIFPQDNEIRASNLIKLWIAEGFVKSICGNDLEIAEEYLKDLIDRNLISVKLTGFTGKIKFCSIHDILRDLCIKEAEKEQFICVARANDLGNRQDLNVQRRPAISQNAIEFLMPYDRLHLSNLLYVIWKFLHSILQER